MAMDFTGRGGGFLSADAVRAYGLVVEGEPIPDDLSGAVQDLITWGFVKIDGGRGGRLVALNPQDIAQRNIDNLLAEATNRITQLKSIRPVAEEMSQHYERFQWRAGNGSEYIDDVSVVNARLDDVVASAEREILAAQPGGPRTREQLERSLERDTAALDRGVTKLTLYRATVRDNPVTAEYVRAMAHRTSGKCAQYATLVGPFQRGIIVDRRTAFISNHLVEGAPAHSAWQITDRAMVAYLAAEFEDKWRRADPWAGETAGRGIRVDAVSSAGGVRTTRRQREILRDMVEGKDRRATAARLGVSERTVSEEINVLRDMFDAKSREQLAFKWAFCPDRLVDDSAPADGGGEVTTEAAA